MCLLTLALPGETQERRHLLTACDNNPDGFGWAIHTGRALLMGHSMVAAEAVDAYLAARSRYDEGPALFHARFATHGTEDLANCHPFRVGADPRIVLAHNGILPIATSPDDPRSDTAVYAADILPSRVLGLDDPAWTRATEEWLGGNKVAILSVSPDLRQPVYLLNEQLGDWTGGVWYSNTSHLHSHAAFTAHYLRPYATDWDVPDICEECDAALDDFSLSRGYCVMCETCLTCLVDIHDCACGRTGGVLTAPRDCADADWWETQAAILAEIDDETGRRASALAS